MSDGDAHNLNNLPIIQAGGCGGYFKVGATVQVDTATASTGATAAQWAGNSESQCADGGTDQMANGLGQATGTAATIANAPINKYFYNIMNAMGVKADSTGFPVKGGTMPVTKFGYSDLTTDFCRRGGRGHKRGHPQSGRVHDSQSRLVNSDDDQGSRICPGGESGEPFVADQCFDFACLVLAAAAAAQSLLPVVRHPLESHHFM